MTHLKEKEIRSSITMSDCLAACDKAFRLYGEGTLRNPPKQQSLRTVDGMDLFHMEMVAHWPGRYWIRKSIEESSNRSTGRLGARKAHIILKDLTTSSEIAMDADYITDMRTGAAGALGIRYISKRPILRASIIGTGRVARWLVMAVDRLYEVEEIVVTSRDSEHRKNFVQSMVEHTRASLRAAETIAECVRNTDAILTAVPAIEPILRPSLLKRRLPISVIAGDPRSRQIAPEVLKKKTIIVDNLNQACASGEFIYAKENKQLKHINLMRKRTGSVMTVGDAACGRLPANHPVEIAYFTGLAALDLLAAIVAYENLVQKLS